VLQVLMSLLLFPVLLVTMVLSLFLNRGLIIWLRASVQGLLAAPLLQQEFLRQVLRVLFLVLEVLVGLHQRQIGQMKMPCPLQSPQVAVGRILFTWSRVCRNPACSRATGLCVFH